MDSREMSFWEGSCATLIRYIQNAVIRIPRR
jgi:hypothetical protein